MLGSVGGPLFLDPPHMLVFVPKHSLGRLFNGSGRTSGTSHGLLVAGKKIYRNALRSCP